MNRRLTQLVTLLAMGDDTIRDKVKPENMEKEPVRTNNYNKLQLTQLIQGDTLQRGDLFLADDGSYVEIDKYGRLFGVVCVEVGDPLIQRCASP